MDLDLRSAIGMSLPYQPHIISRSIENNHSLKSMTFQLVNQQYVNKTYFKWRQETECSIQRLQIQAGACTITRDQNVVNVAQGNSINEAEQVFDCYLQRWCSVVNVRCRSRVFSSEV